MIVTSDRPFFQVAKLLPDLRFSDNFETADIPSKDVTGLVVRLGTVLSRSLLARFPSLKFVASITTGHDHIQTEYCDEKNIKVLSLRGETEFLQSIHATPEHTWGLLLALTRNISPSFQSVKNGAWQREPFFGYELQGKKLGIIGCGRVGGIVGQYARAFGMQVLAYDRNPIQTEGVTQVVLHELLADSDVISVHLSLDKTTQGFLGHREFSSMRRRPWLINTSRGAIVDEQALLQALKGGVIRGAALDVLANELSFAADGVKNPLIDYAREYDNLLLTPHIAGSTLDSMERTALFIEQKIADYLHD